MNWTAIIVFVLLFGFITVLGFAAAYWRRGDLDKLNEWGLGGRRFGNVVIWFLLGGDVYTAYTFIAVPALTYTSGLRAPAMIAVVKDTLIYLTVLAMVIVIPIELGGYDKMFAMIPPVKLLLAGPTDGNLGQFSAYATLALGSAFALFLYPHTVTGVLSSSGANVIRRNAAYLPAYSFLLGLLALTGFMALAVGVDKLPEFAPQFARYKSNFAVPALILHAFPDWFVGIAFAAIGIGGLVPAAIMSIAASNLFTRNIYKQFIRPDCTPKEEAQNAKIMSFIVKFGALLFIIFLPLQYAIQLQLLGGIWISQTIPSVIVGLYIRWLNPWALIIGWAAGLISGTWMAASLHFQSAVFPLVVDGITVPGYAALYALGINFGVSIVLSAVLNPMRTTRGTDQTAPADYHFDAAGGG